MITKETLKAVREGVLTDDQLRQALTHYQRLTDDLKCHGERYHLVWLDAYNTLQLLNSMAYQRKEFGNLYPF